MTTAKRPGRWSSCSLRHAVIVSLALILLSGPGSSATGDDAKALLQRMSIYLAKQQTIRLAFDSAIEVITPELEKIQFTNSGEALLARPDRLRAHRVGGYSDVALYFDGKAVSIYGKALNAYARFEGPATVDALIEALRAGHGVALPGADLLLSNSYEVLLADVLEAKHVGRGIVDGHTCEHLAFRNLDTDWQLWIESGDRPRPCKLVITSKTLASAPQYTLTVTAWDTGVTVDPRDFVFVAPGDARVLAHDQLIEFDELPQGAPTGGSQ